MKEVKNEEVCNSFGSLLFLLSILRSIEEEYENEIDISWKKEEVFLKNMWTKKAAYSTNFDWLSAEKLLYFG